LAVSPYGAYILGIPLSTPISNQEARKQQSPYCQYDMQIPVQIKELLFLDS